MIKNDVQSSFNYADASIFFAVSFMLDMGGYANLIGRPLIMQWQRDVVQSLCDMSQ